MLVARRLKSHPGRPWVPAERQFAPRSERALASALGALGSVVTFYGDSESLAETAVLFSRAKVVVGYHGAGLANVVWQRSSPACAVEISALYEDGRHWRSNAEMADFNHRLNWTVVGLELGRLLATNNNDQRPESERYPLVKGVRNADRWLKQVPVVELADDDVARVVAAAAACARRPPGGAR